MVNNSNPLSVILSTGTMPQIISNPQIGDKFKSLYKTIHGITDDARAEAYYNVEKFHFLKLIETTPAIQQCTKLSLYGIFMDVAVTGLSFDPSMKHVYVVPFNVNVGTKDAPKWEKRAQLMISGYGELLLRKHQGQVKYVDNPVIVYEGDHFKYGMMNGQTILEHLASIPRQSNNIIAAYLRIVRPDDTVDYKVMTIDDIMNLRKFSKDPNSKAWTDGLAGMVQSKIIKHAFRNYPKLRVGQNTTIETDSNTAHNHYIDDNVEYAPTMIVEPVTGEVNTGDFATTTEEPEPKPVTEASSNTVGEELNF